jgi:hypothetical protein
MHRMRWHVHQRRGCPTRLSGQDTCLYGRLPAVLRLQPDFGGELDCPFLIGDRPRKQEEWLMMQEARSLHPHDGWDPLVGLEELHASVAWVDDEHTIEVVELS